MLNLKKTLSMVVVMNLFLSFAFGFQAFADDGMVESGVHPDANVAEQVLQPSEEMISTLTKDVSELDSSKLKNHRVKVPVNLESATASSELQKGLISAPQSIIATATAETNTYTGYIQQEGTSSFLYPIYVQPGSILQVQMDNPASAQLDYDLYLYEFDMSTGDLNPTPIDYSIYGTYLNNYGNGSRTLSENVGTKNSTASSKAYLIEAYGAVGGSINEAFTLTVSTSSTYDSYETDENALHAYPFTVATGGSTLSSRSINSEVDQDWYKITVPESRNYDAMHIDLDQASVGNGYKAELYGALSNNRMALMPSTNGNVSLGTGTYYLRVYTASNYSDNNYSLHLQPVLRADKVVITGYNSNGGPNDYPTYAYGRYYRITGTSFTVTGVAATSDNYAVANAEVEVLWENDYWTEGSNNRYRSAKVMTNSSGQFTATLSLPPSTGSISQYLPGAISFTHYYDICGVLAKVTNRPSANDTDIVYHFAYSIYGG
ncbi:hypothetical protein [Paenibacillus tundrae]|uniref:hypothetical protein n=1 Tax=Paenibacillus tundrae TaxID=528187 RepID=UPI0022A92D12|nr:hypothetical protein [Paenibacillus tundrae]MCZ1265691.1 hypothetical protein [Paenibacillus tundrae]